MSHLRLKSTEEGLWKWRIIWAWVTMRDSLVNGVITCFVQMKYLNIRINAFNIMYMGIKIYADFMMLMVSLSSTRPLAFLHLQPNLCIPQLTPIKQMMMK